MPPLKGEGDREAVERCAPGANVSPFHNLPAHSKTPRDESLGALHTGNLPESDSGKIKTDRKR